MKGNKTKRIILVAIAMLTVGIVGKSNVYAYNLSCPFTFPTVEIDNNPTGWTNKDVVLTITAIDEEDGSGIKEITLPDGNKVTPMEEKALSLTTEYTITANGSYIILATNNCEYEEERTFKVDKIDKVAPTKPSLNKINDKLVLVPGADALSGIDKHMYSVNDGEWIEFTTDIDIIGLAPGNYTIKLKAIDKATNKSEIFDLNFNVEKIGDADNNTTLKNAERFVQMAEVLNREPHIAKAKNVVSALNPSEEKTILLLRIEEIKGPLSEESKALIEAMTYVETAEKYGYVSIIRKTEEKVNALKDSFEKTVLFERLSKFR